MTENYDPALRKPRKKPMFAQNTPTEVETEDITETNPTQEDIDKLIAEEKEIDAKLRKGIENRILQETKKNKDEENKAIH